MLRLHVLGPVRVEQDEHLVGGIDSRKALAVLCYLAVRGQPMPRRHLADLFWPDQLESQGRASLSRVLYRISSVLSDSLDADRHTVAVGDVWLDTSAFAALVAQDTIPALAAATELYRGDFMLDLDLDGCPDFELWLLQEREVWRQRQALALDTLVRRHAEAGNYPTALEFARRMLAGEPWNEEGHRHVMRLLAQMGHRREAVAQYEACQRVLATDLGVVPSAETTHLYEQIRTALAEEPSPAILTTPPLVKLPPRLNVFIDREMEMAAMLERLADATCRLLTLVGPGGVGKTRLALEAARRLAETQATAPFPDGMVYVPLAALDDPGLVGAALCEALEIQDAGGPLVATLIERLRARRMLLIVDNFEQVTDAAAVISRLLGACPYLKFLVTSRMPLHVSGEQEYLVPPLPAPSPANDEPGYAGGPADAEAASEVEMLPAVKLFVERARAVEHDFAVTGTTAPAVAEICASLDGLPLAIELAAVRVKTLSPQAIADRLRSGGSDGLRFLRSETRDAMARHRSLHTAIDWSYGLLTPNEQRLLRCLSVFMGGFTLEAAQAVYLPAADASAAPPDILDEVASLVDQSLLRHRAQEYGDRYLMLRVIREYGLERLAQAGESDVVQARHAAYYLNLAELARQALLSGEQTEWFRRLEQDSGNLRAALAWYRDQREAQAGLRMVGALGPFWQIRGHLSEGQQWLETMLDVDAGEPSRRPNESLSHLTSKAQALYSLGRVYKAQRNLPAAHAALAESVGVWRRIADVRGLADALSYLGDAMVDLANPAGARRILDEALALQEEVGSAWGLAMTHHALGNLGVLLDDLAMAHMHYQTARTLLADVRDLPGLSSATKELSLVVWRQGDQVRGPKLLAESLALAQESGYAIGIPNAYRYEGYMAYDLGDFPRAALLYEESLRANRNLGRGRAIAIDLYLLAAVLCRMGLEERAAALLEESLSLFHGLGEEWGIAFCLAMLAAATMLGAQNRAIAERTAELVKAATLFGAADRLLKTLQAAVEHEPYTRVRPNAVFEAHDTYCRETKLHLARLRASLDCLTFDNAWAQGQAMALENVMNDLILPSNERGAR